MILELDCGNTFIKWRTLLAGRNEVLAAGQVRSAAELLLELQSRHVGPLSFVRIVSVRGEDETGRLAVALRKQFAVEIALAAPTKFLAGVSNGYADFQRLGLDRWLALVAAYQLNRRACLVLDLGTAITADFVTDDGQHLGGFICPGMPLMRNQLCSHTHRIKLQSAVGASSSIRLAPGKTTDEAVDRGCLYMIRGFIYSQRELGRQLLGEDFDLFVTGGDAALVADIAPQARLMSDLVFSGLALACPLEGA